MSINSKLWFFSKKLSLTGTFATPIPIAEGGTNAITAAAARTSLDVPAVADTLTPASNLNDLVSAPTARTNLGLGSSAVTNVGILVNNVPQLGVAGVMPAVGKGLMTGFGTAADLDVGTTANKVLQLDGSAKIPAVDGSLLTNLPNTGDVVLLGTVVASDQASVEFESLITSTYDQYEIRYYDVTRSTGSGVKMFMYSSSDNGTTYDTGASDYHWSALGNNSGSTGASGQGQAGIGFMSLIPGEIDGTAGHATSGRIEIWDPLNTSTQTNFTWKTISRPDTGNMWQFSGGGVRKEAAIVDAIQFKFNSGNILTGTFKLYGIK